MPSIRPVPNRPTGPAGRELRRLAVALVGGLALHGLAHAQTQNPTASPAGDGLSRPAAGSPATGFAAWGPLPDRFVPDEGGRAAGLQEGSVWSAHLSPLTWHSNPSPDHVHSVGLGLRRALDGRQFLGVNAFSNSFGQPSVYAMYGQRLHGGVPAVPKFYVEWTAGLIYGYVGDRSDEVPLNVKGLSPAFTLSPGWQFTPQFSAQLNVIGTVAVMVQFDWRFR